MPTINSIEGFLDQYSDGEITDYNNPTCKGCNECCSIIVMITKEEFMRLRKFLRHDNLGKQIFKRGINLITRYRDQGTLYLMCPFCNSKKRCEIYSMRPKMCRDFHCTKELATPDYDQYKKELERSEHLTIWELWKHSI